MQVLTFDGIISLDCSFCGELSHGVKLLEIDNLAWTYYICIPCAVAFAAEINRAIDLSKITRQK